MYTGIPSFRNPSNLSNTPIPEGTSKNSAPSASEQHDAPVSSGNPQIKAPSEITEEIQAGTDNPSSSLFASKKATSPSSLQVEYLKQKAAFEGEISTQRDSAIQMDDVHLPPSTSSSSAHHTTRSLGLPRFATAMPSWMTRNSALRKAGVVLGETINHATIAALVWGTISPLINQANGSSSVDGGDYKGNYRIAALNTLAMIPISMVLTNVLFAVMRGIMGYKIEKTQLDEAFSDPGTVARLKSAQNDSDYSGAIADVLYSSVFGAGMVAGSQIPAWTQETGLSEKNQQIVNSAIQIAIAAAALALVRTSVMLSRTVDGQSAYEIKSLGHHNPLKNLAKEFKATIHTKRKDEPANISSTYRTVRNLVLRMLEEASVWGGATLYSAPAGISAAAVRSGANNPLMQFLNGYMTVTFGYFFDEGNSLHKDRINEDFSPWKFLGSWGATKDLILPDLPPPSSTVHAVRESAGKAAVAQSILKDVLNIGERVLHAKNVATVYGPRILLDAATSAEHELVKLLPHYQQYRLARTSSVIIEEINPSEAAQAQGASTSQQTGNEEAISSVAEVAPTGTHDNPSLPIETVQPSHTNPGVQIEETPSEVPQAQNADSATQPVETTQPSRTNPDVQIEEINSSETPHAQDASALPQTGNEEAVLHVAEVVPSGTHNNPLLAIDAAQQLRLRPVVQIEGTPSGVPQAQDASTSLQVGSEEAVSHITQEAPVDTDDNKLKLA